MRAERLNDNMGWTSVGTGEDLTPRTVSVRLRDGAVWLLVGTCWLLLCLPLAVARAVTALTARVRGTR